MKTKLLFLVMTVILGLNFAFATEPEVAVKKMINDQITYPDFAVKSLIEGKVYVTFSIDQDGKITVKESNSLNEELRKYVVEKMDDLKVTPGKDYDGKTYSMKFTFELKK
jgi:outer membrane biosynthesis protein TonB